MKQSLKAKMTYQITKIKKGTDMKTIEMLNEFLKVTSPMKRAGTIKYEQNIIRSLTNMINDLKIHNPKRITFETGYKIVEYFKNTKTNRNNSINNYMVYLKRVMTHYEIRSTIYKFPKLKSDTVPFKRFNDNELRKIIHHMRDLHETQNSLVYRTFVYLLLDSGMRVSEMIRLNINDFDFDNMTILLRETKTHKTRYVPFSEFSKNHILELRNKGPKRVKLFWNFLANREFEKDDIRNFFKRLGRRLQIDGIHSHRFRKTFATKLRENGARLEAIQYLLGHSRLATTMIYVDLRLDATLEEYHKFNQWISPSDQA